MDVKDLRIGDIVGVKSFENGKNRCIVRTIDDDGYVNVYYEKENDTCDVYASTILGKKADNDELVHHGAWYDDKKVEYIFTFKGGLRIAVRPQIGCENFIATRIGEYRPKYCKFTYIHELQHWLWDFYKVEL